MTVTANPPAGGGMDADLLGFIVDRVESGIFVVDRDRRVTLWNRFLASHSGMAAPEVVGRVLYEVFPDLPRDWLERKLEAVFLLRNFAFSDWQQRPYLFRFRHDRAWASAADCMRQNLTFMPLRDASGAVTQVCVTVFDVTEASLLQTQLRETGLRDGLTQCFNRAHFDAVLPREVARASRYNKPLTLLLADVDHFKRVNDTYGHPAGDAVLRAVAAQLGRSLRDSDLLARYGGEEFAIILPETGFGDAMQVAERLRGMIDQARIDLPGLPALQVSASFGVASLEGVINSGDKLLAAADAALYRAKHTGRNRVVAASASG